MHDARQLRKNGSHWLLAVPREVRAWLGITHPVTLYWHWGRKGEATITVEETRLPGRAPVAQLARQLAQAEREIAAVRKRDETRDRGQYAEGFAHGYLKAYNLLVRGDGPAREAGDRARRYFNAFPDAARAARAPDHASAPPASKPRPNSRRGKVARASWTDAVSVDTYAASSTTPRASAEPAPSPSAPPAPVPSEGEAVTPGPSVPGDP